MEGLLSLVTMMEEDPLGDASVAQVPATWHEDLNSDHQYPITELGKATHTYNP